MCPHNLPGQNTPSFDLNTLPPKLRAVYESSRRLAQIRAEMIAAGNLAKALERTSGKKPEAGEPGAQPAE